jgi:SSS family solute:Na+ symporter
MSPAIPHAGLTLLDAAAVLAYFVATLLIALISTRRKRSTEEFFLAGRRMPWLAVGLSITATLMSTISYLAVPGEMIQYGVAMFAGYLSLPLSMFVVLWGWVPFFMRLRMTSAYEYLEQRFNYAARCLAALLFILLRMGWMAVIIFTAAMALEKMIGLDGLVPPWGGTSSVLSIEPLYLWIALVGAFTTIYTAVGGIRAVIWTDVMQSLVMFAGTIVTLSYVIWATGSGPLAWWQAASAARIEHTHPPLFSLAITTRVTIVTAMLHSFFWIICTHGSDQMIVQRYFTTVSLRAARRSYFASALADVAVSGLLALCGLALLSFYLRFPSHLSIDIDPRTSADRVFPYFIGHQLRWGLGGVILSALFAAGMSSVASGINSVAAVATTDIFARLLPGGERFMSGFALARWLSLAIGLAATAMAAGIAMLVQQSRYNIMELMAKGFNMFLGPLAALFFIGMFLPRSTARSALPAVVLGLGFSIVWSYWQELPLFFETLGQDDLASRWRRLLGANQAPTFTLAIALPCVVTFLLAAGLSYVVETPHRAARPLTWYAVMRGSGGADC